MFRCKPTNTYVSTEAKAINIGMTTMLMITEALGESCRRMDTTISLMIQKVTPNVNIQIHDKLAICSMKMRREFLVGVFIDHSDPKFDSG